MLLTIDQLLQKKLIFFQFTFWEGMNFKSCLVFGIFAKVLQHLSGGMHPKAHDQASVSILSVAMFKTPYDIPLY